MSQETLSYQIVRGEISRGKTSTQRLSDCLTTIFARLLSQSQLRLFFSRLANLTRDQSNGLLCPLLRVQKGTQCSRFLVPRCDVHDLKTLERVLLKLSLPS